MATLKLLAVVSFIALLSQLQGCRNSESNQRETVFKQIPAIAEIKPERPVKIKLKRNAEGEYSWDLSGDDAGKVMETDREIRESLSGKQQTLLPQD